MVSVADDLSAPRQRKRTTNLEKIGQSAGRQTPILPFLSYAIKSTLGLAAFFCIYFPPTTPPTEQHKHLFGIAQRRYRQKI